MVFRGFTRPPGTSARNHPSEPTASKPVVPGMSFAVHSIAARRAIPTDVAEVGSGTSLTSRARPGYVPRRRGTEPQRAKPRGVRARHPDPTAPFWCDVDEGPQAARDRVTLVVRTVSAMTVTEPTDVAWDLEPLVDGEGAAGRRPPARRGRRARRARSPRRYAGRVADLDGPGLAAAMAELQAISELVGRAGTYALAALRRRHRRPGQRRAAGQRVQERATAIETQAAVLRPRVGRARRRARRGAAGRRRPGHAPPPPAHAPPLPPAPPLRARGEDHGREGASPAATPGRACSPS